MDVVRPTKESILETLRYSVEAVKAQRLADEKVRALREQTKIAEEEWCAANEKMKSATHEWGKTVSIAQLSDLDDLLGKWLNLDWLKP